MGPTSRVCCLYILYAGDLLCALAHEHLPILSLAEWENTEDTLQEMAELGPPLAGEKSEGLLISPKHTAEDVFRRRAGLSRKGHYGVKKRDDQLEALRKSA